MSTLDGIVIEKGPIGPDMAQNRDSVSAFVIAAEPTGKLQTGVPVELRSLSEALALGIDENYDTINNLNVYRHIKEFYRMAGEGTKLFLTLSAKEDLLDVMIEKHAKALLSHAGGRIRQIGFAVQKRSEQIVNGLPEETLDAIAKAQETALWAFDHDMPCHFFLEGGNIGDNVSSLQDLRDTDPLKAHKVSLVIGQDHDYARTKKDQAQKFAEVGTALGVCAGAKVSQNIGEIQAFNLTDGARGIWVNPGLSSHKRNTEVIESLKSLEDKGYLYGYYYSCSQSGVRWKSDPVCAPVERDAEGNINEHSIAFSRVTDKAVRELRSAYMPLLKSSHLLNEKGELPTGVIKYFESIGDKVFEGMKARGEISKGKVSLDKGSDILTQKTLKIAFSLIPLGSVDKITAKINLKTQI